MSGTTPTGTSSTSNRRSGSWLAGCGGDDSSAPEGGGEYVASTSVPSGDTYFTLVGYLPDPRRLGSRAHECNRARGFCRIAPITCGAERILRQLWRGRDDQSLRPCEWQGGGWKQNELRESRLLVRSGFDGDGLRRRRPRPLHPCRSGGRRGVERDHDGDRADHRARGSHPRGFFFRVSTFDDPPRWQAPGSDQLYELRVRGGPPAHRSRLGRPGSAQGRAFASTSPVAPGWPSRAPTTARLSSST
jgi:hypothetical protein